MRAANDDDEGPDELGDRPGLIAASRFARMVPNLAWFSRLGEELEEEELEEAEAYLAALGFPDAGVVGAENWTEAEEAARNLDWNTAGWEAEEQLRAALIAQACENMDEDELMVALANVTARASDAVHEAAMEAAAQAGVKDEALVRAAAGAAAQAAYLAALVLAADAGDDHPFAIKFRLFEVGRWPIGIIGNTFTVF